MDVETAKVSTSRLCMHGEEKEKKILLTDGQQRHDWTCMERVELECGEWLSGYLT